MIEVLLACLAAIVVLIGAAFFAVWREWSWSERKLREFEDSEERWK